MAGHDGLKRWIEAERVRSRLRTLGFAVAYARARYAGCQEEFEIVPGKGRVTSAAAKADVLHLLEDLRRRWARRQT